MARTSTLGMTGVGIAAAIGFVFALTFFNIGGNNGGDPGVIETVGRTPTPFITVSEMEGTQELKKFSSINEVEDFLQRVSASSAFFSSGASYFSRTTLMITDSDLREGVSNESVTPAQSQSQLQDDQSANPDAGLDSLSKDFSSTNVQVQNVDEPDFIKNDGKYAYILNGDKLTIVNAFPAEGAEIVAKVGLDVQPGQSMQDMFLNGDRLVIFYQEYSEDYVIQEYDFAPYPVYSPRTHAIILDISDRENPATLRDYEINGNYHDTRMIGDNILLVTSTEIYDYNHPIIPYIMESSKVVVTPDVYYFDNPEQYYSFNTVSLIDVFVDVKGGNATDSEGGLAGIQSSTFMMNPSSTIYVSEDNLYITYQKNLPYTFQETHSRDRFFEVIVPLLPQDVQDEIKSIDNDGSLDSSEKWDRISEVLQETYNTRLTESEKNQLFEKIQNAVAEYERKSQTQTLRTVIHRIDISSANGMLNYGAAGEVPGRILNQFSMDEDGDRFRIATTSEIYTQYQTRLHNNVYVLDSTSLKTVGSLEGIAPDESIYSARFMGDRLYLVTFERIDPFFVIDMSSDKPKVLGELKLPGYSNYLHPYDADHVIGIGKETKENQYGGIETLGVKLALFDVSDVQNPKVVDVFEIGKQGTDSEVLWDHKAFLFSKGKNVLSLPITINEYSEPILRENGEYIYPAPKFWQGFYVFGIDPEQGFKLKGTVDHSEKGTQQYYYGSGSRSFYIEDVLYTVTNGNVMKMNDLGDLHEINELDLGSTGELVKYVD